AHPAATGLGAGPHDLAEGGLVGARVVEDLDDLDVPLVRERQDHVAGAEARMQTTIDRCDPEGLTKALSSGLDTALVGCKGDVVNAHGGIVTQVAIGPVIGSVRPPGADGPPRRRRWPPTWRH